MDPQAKRRSSLSLADGAWARLTPVPDRGGARASGASALDACPARNLDRGADDAIHRKVEASTNFGHVRSLGAPA
jgi:hypothetical protein